MRSPTLIGEDMDNNDPAFFPAYSQPNSPNSGNEQLYPGNNPQESMQCTPYPNAPARNTPSYEGYPEYDNIAMTYGYTPFFDRSLQLENINTAYFLEKKLAGFNAEKKGLLRRKPNEPDMPPRPSVKTVSPDLIPYPKYKYPKNPGWRWLKVAILLAALFVFSILAAILTTNAPAVSQVAIWVMSACMFAAPACLVVAIYNFFTFSDKYTKKLIASKEFQENRDKIDEQNAIIKANANAKAQNDYMRDVEIYNTQTVPDYNQRLNHFNSIVLPEWKKEYSLLQNVIDATNATLQEVYSANIIPGKYRNLDALTFISSYMGTSQFDLGTTLQRLDHDVEQKMMIKQIKLLEAIHETAKEMLKHQGITNYLLGNLTLIAQQGNDILRSSRNWQRANTALHIYSIYKQGKQ